MRKEQEDREMKKESEIKKQIDDVRNINEKMVSQIQSVSMMVKDMRD
jgi:hypothetical protein